MNFVRHNDSAEGWRLHVSDTVCVRVCVCVACMVCIS
jgi:hypothetical protein